MSEKSIQLTPNEYKTFVKKLYFLARELGNGIPTVYVFGPPGVGKSVATRELAREIAEELGKEFVEIKVKVHFKVEGGRLKPEYIIANVPVEEILKKPSKYFLFIDLRLITLEPSDLIGIPREVNGYIVYKPMMWAALLSLCDGILFLDEFTNTSLRYDLQGAAYQLTLDKIAGFVEFSKGVMVIAAGNKPEHAPGLAQPLVIPLANRGCILEMKEATIEEWAEWMNKKYGDNWNKRILAYLLTYKTDFLKLPEHGETTTNFPSPRTWTMTAVYLAKKKYWSEKEILVACTGWLGKDVGVKVAKFLTKNVPSINEILKSPEKFKELDLDVQCIFTVFFSQWCLEDFNRIDREDVKKLLRIILETKHELALLFFHAAGSRRFELAIKVLKTCPEYDKYFDELLQLIREVENEEKN